MQGGIFIIFAFHFTEHLVIDCCYVYHTLL